MYISLETPKSIISIHYCLIILVFLKIRIIESDTHENLCNENFFLTPIFPSFDFFFGQPQPKKLNFYIFHNFLQSYNELFVFSNTLDLTQIKIVLIFSFLLSEFVEPIFFPYFV